MLKVALKLEPNQDAGDAGVAGLVPNRDAWVARQAPYQDAGLAGLVPNRDAGVARQAPFQDAGVAMLVLNRDVGIARQGPYQDAGVAGSFNHPPRGHFWILGWLISGIMNTVQIVNTVRLVFLEIGRLINFET